MMDDKLNSTATTMSLFCRSMEFNQRYLGHARPPPHEVQHSRAAGRQAEAGVLRTRMEQPSEQHPTAGSWRGW